MLAAARLILRCVRWKLLDSGAEVLAPVVPVCVQACNVMLRVLLSCGTGRTVPVASPADVKPSFPT